VVRCRADGIICPGLQKPAAEIGLNSDRRSPACVGKKHSKSLATARCIRATLPGIMDHLPFLPLCAHILIPKISAIACLAVQQGSGAFGG
jgi:hypothetical protein